ncbi:MAG: DUF1761 domain-containing protein [Deltaproteobacteria bacterium]|nr:DUF1761 domain-containing protein [Deltaproteobacteria bacterium]
MGLASLNWLAILAATLAAFVAGGLWFGPKTFFPVWWRAMGRSADEQPGKGQNMGVVFGSTFVAALVQAITVAIVCNWLAQSRPGFAAADGAQVGLLLGVGLAAASSLSHRLFGGFSFQVWALEVGSDALNLTIMGTILGAWR